MWSSLGELFKYYTGNQMYINFYLFISHKNQLHIRTTAVSNKESHLQKQQNEEKKE